MFVTDLPSVQAFRRKIFPSIRKVAPSDFKPMPDASFDFCRCSNTRKCSLNCPFTSLISFVTQLLLLSGKFVLLHQDFSFFFFFFFLLSLLFSLVLHNLFHLFLVIPFSIHVHCFPVVRSIKRNFRPINEQGKYFRANIYIKGEHGKGWFDLFKETANTNELRGVIAFLFLYALYNDYPRIYFTLFTFQHRVCTYNYAERLLLLRLRG